MFIKIYKQRELLHFCLFIKEKVVYLAIQLFEENLDGRYEHPRHGFA
jgi:hypothetical protein